MRIKRQQPERDLQALCVTYFREFYSEYADAACSFDGNSVSMRHGVTKKAQGYTSGFPDWFFAASNSKARGLFVEFKSEVGKLSARQVIVHAALKKQGYSVVIVRTFNEFRETLEEYLGKKVSAAKRRELKRLDALDNKAWRDAGKESSK